MSNPGEVASTNSSSNKSFCYILGHIFTRKEIVLFFQILLVYIVVITSLINLTFYGENNKRTQLWVALLSASLGYILPNPTLNINR